MSWVVDGRIVPRSRDSVAYAVETIESGVDVVAGQGNGMDAGPYYLGSDDVSGMRRQDVGPLILSAKRQGIPFIFSFGGRAGADHQLNHYLADVGRIAAESGVRLRLAVISGEIKKEYLKRKIRSGIPISRLVETPRLTESLSEEQVDRAVRIQAQMGPEPIIAALHEPGIDGVITGRAVDLAVLASYPLHKGIPKATACHAAAILECGTIAGEPSDPLDAVVADISDTSFTVTCPNPRVRLTERSVGAKSLYERADPFAERNPGGVLNLGRAKYEQIDERTVRCSGAEWQEAPYTIKLEGADHVGYQSTVTFGVRDPDLIANMDAVVESVTSVIRELASPEEITITTHLYGRDGSLGSAEPETSRIPHELGVLYMVTARTQQRAEELARFARSRFMFADFPGRRTPGGNIALPLQPAASNVGPVYAFNIWHLLPLDDPCEPFPYKIVEFE